MFIKPPQGATAYEDGVFQADRGVCAATLRVLDEHSNTQPTGSHPWLRSYALCEG